VFVTSYFLHRSSADTTSTITHCYKYDKSSKKNSQTKL